MYLIVGRYLVCSVGPRSSKSYDSDFKPLPSPYTVFNSVATNRPDKLTAENILKK